MRVKGEKLMTLVMAWSPVRRWVIVPKWADGGSTRYEFETRSGTLLLHLNGKSQLVH